MSKIASFELMIGTVEKENGALKTKGISLKNLKFFENIHFKFSFKHSPKFGYKTNFCLIKPICL